ncbi:MAG: SIMPL domain-containing protein [Candidatus Pacebacteria bacterium]|nr:SIMPL domain-containing protein [Candidatus Paceibacterota bacterium]
MENTITKKGGKKVFIIIISVTILVCALIFLAAAKGFSNQGKYVEVKGLSERIVKSDRAIWPINFEVKSNNSEDLFSQINTYIGEVKNFLLKAGFTEDEISTAPVQTYQDTYQSSLYRYNAHISMSVYTDKVDLVKQTSQNTLELIKKGVIMTDSYIQFEYSDINNIKSEMLAEAIANARSSAEEFARDSGVSVGSIARANQGVFTITDKDPGSPEFKNVRVVSTLRYLLK